jgi:hypothetical protein
MATQKYRELPEWIRHSKSFTNIQNKDSASFKWCVLRFFNKEERFNHRATKLLKSKENNYIWYGLDNTETLNTNSIIKFEDKYNIMIIIFQITSEPGYNIVYMGGYDRDNPKYTKIYLGLYIDHFFLINNLQVFIGCGIRKIKDQTCSYYWCDFCFKYFSSKNILDNHIRKCKDLSPIYHYPKQDSFISFINYYKMLPYAAVCYADFEATTTKDNIQTPNSFCLFCPDLKYIFKGYSPYPLDLFGQFWYYLNIIENRLKEKYKELYSTGRSRTQ